MTDITSKISEPESSITLFSALVSTIAFTQLSETQLYDLSAIATESAEGLCHGLLALGESLENIVDVPNEHIGQANAYIKAAAHVIPALMAICEQSNYQLMKITEG